MIIPYKDRKIKAGQSVQVYRNLHNNMFSIRCAKTRLVLAHGDGFIIDSSSYYVSEKGREKVIQKKSKNVHAWVCGTFASKNNIVGRTTVDEELYYNPYEQKHFILKESGKIAKEGLVLFEQGKAFVLESPDFY